MRKYDCVIKKRDMDTVKTMEEESGKVELTKVWITHDTSARLVERHKDIG